MNRILPDTDFTEAIAKMAEGNPGALTVLLRMLKKPDQEKVDITSLEFAEGYINLCKLDDMEIYGSNIWVGYKDVCGEDLDLFISKVADLSIKEELKKMPRYQ